MCLLLLQPSPTPNLTATQIPPLSTPGHRNPPLRPPIIERTHRRVESGTSCPGDVTRRSAIVPFGLVETSAGAADEYEEEDRVAGVVGWIGQVVTQIAVVRTGRCIVGLRCCKEGEMGEKTGGDEGGRGAGVGWESLFKFDRRKLRPNCSSC